MKYYVTTRYHSITIESLYQLYIAKNQLVTIKK
jgi:hypothetical protein